MIDLAGGTLSLDTRYAIVDEISRSERVVVYAGVQKTFNRDVTIFVLLQASSLERSQMAKMGGELHPAVSGFLSILDFGEVEEGVPFLVTERTSCESFRDRCDEEGTLRSATVERLIAGMQRGFEQIALLPHPDWIFVDDSNVWIDPVGCWMSSTFMERDPLQRTPKDQKPTAFFVIASLAYRALSGANPFFDVSGELVDEKFVALAEVGVDGPWAGVELALSNPTAADKFAEENVVEEPFEEFVHRTVEHNRTISPTAGGTAIAVVVLALFVSNAVWLFVLAQNQDENNTAKVLRSDVVVESAKPAVVRNGDTILGDTPVSLDAKILGSDEIGVDRDGEIVLKFRLENDSLKLIVP